MIKLEKGPKPEILETNGAEWTRILVEKRSSGEEPTSTEKTRYRHPQIKEALVTETHNKCAYCESKLQHIHHGDVEHIMPKSLDPSKTLEWENLTLACEMCNQKKSNLDPNANQIIDPYTVDPRDFLVFNGPFIFSMGSPSGIATKVILDLDRPELIETRSERLKYIMSIYAEVLRPDIPILARRAIYKNLVKTEASPSMAYSAMVQDTIAAMQSRVPDEIKQ